MAMFYVRLIEDKEPVGVFYATTIRNLFSVVDEQLSPMSCEYIQVKAGGFFFDGCTKLTHVDDEDESIHEYWTCGRANPSEVMDEAYVDPHEEPKFKPFKNSHWYY